MRKTVAVREYPETEGKDGEREEVVTARMRMPFLKRTIFTGGASLISAFGILASGILVARLLGPEGTGMVSLATWVAITASIVAGLGLPVTIERFLPELEASNSFAEAERLKNNLVRVTMLSVLASCLVLWMLWQFVWRPLDAWLWFLVAAAVATQALADFYFAYCRASQRFGELAILNALSFLIRIPLLVAGAMTIGVYGPMIAVVVALAVPAGLAIGLARSGDVPLHAPVRDRAIKFSASAWLVSIFYSLVWTRAEVVFIQAYLGVEAVGLFAAALALGSMIVLLPSLLTGALLPYLSEKIADGEQEQIKNSYSSMFVAVSLVVLPVCMGTAGISPVLIPLLFGEDFVAAVPSAAVLSVMSATSIFVMFSHSLLFRFEKGNVLLVSNAVGLTLIVAAGFLVIPVYGVLGAAISRGVVHCIVILIELHVARRLGFGLPRLAMLKLIASASGCGLIAYFVTTAIGGPLSLLVGIPAAAVVYGAGVRLTGALSAVDRAMLDSALGCVPRRLRRPADILFRLLCGPQEGEAHSR